MKYRRLKKDELEELKTEFIRFLASHTITGQDWSRLKTEEPQKANELVDIFSDIVFENILKKIEYLEFKSPKDIKVFKCQADKIIMMGIVIEGKTDIDFTKDTEPGSLKEQLHRSGAKVKLYRAEKKYTKERELELFGMMEQGCLIAKEQLFKTLESLTKAQKN